MKKPLTQRERVAIFALACGYIDTWTDCYIASTQENEDTTRRRGGLPTTVQRWKTRLDVQDTFEGAKRFLYEREKQALERIRREEQRRGEEERGADGERIKTEPEPKRGTIDYMNPENQAKKLNELINRADNTGEALDALKVIIATQKADRESARDGKQVRCYLPMTCSACPLYEEAKKG